MFEFVPVSDSSAGTVDYLTPELRFLADHILVRPDQAAILGARGFQYTEFMGTSMFVSLLRKHIAGELTLGTYSRTTDDRARWLYWALPSSSMFSLENPLGIAWVLQSWLRTKLGLYAGLEQLSKSTPVRLWLFWEDYISVSKLFCFKELVQGSEALAWLTPTDRAAISVVPAFDWHLYDQNDITIMPFHELTCPDPAANHNQFVIPDENGNWVVNNVKKLQINPVHNLNRAIDMLELIKPARSPRKPKTLASVSFTYPQKNQDPHNHHDDR